jgi:acyl-CoA synthetase (AMP-forming)/AMP-acid ligase II/pyrroloquinoline quinone (PQQ) biosynthesis protein C
VRVTALGEALRHNANTRGTAMAIDGGAAGQLSWSELLTRVERCAATFGEQFGAGGRPIATDFEHGLNGAIADLALMETGVAAIPLPSFYTAQQRAHALAASGAQAIISGGSEFVIEACAGEAVSLHPETAKISFTSGSTGTPKGISLSGDHMLAVARAVVNALGESHAGRHLALLPPAILLENIAGFYATILAGGTYVALPPGEVGLGNPFRPDFAATARAIEVHQITSLILVPEYLGGLVATMEASGMRFPALTLVAVGGARVSPALLERARIVGLPVRQGYGLTECGSVVSLESGNEADCGSVGKSLGLNKIIIAEDGEILIEGFMCLGAETPYHTGDIGRIDYAGNLWIEGRKSNLIITTHGRNISPEWVESALLAQGGVAQAMVYGEAAPSLSALLVPSSLDANLDAAVAAANATLPEYAQVAQWRGVLPFTPANGQLTGNGRPRRDAISAAYLDATAPFFDRLVADTASGQLHIASVPQLRAGLAGEINRETYIAYLSQAYHHVCHTVPLMQEARARLAHKPELVAALEDYIEEETGHEHWILSDIDAAGGSGQTVANSAPNAATKAMVDHAYHVIRTGNPAAFFGMVYVLEGTSIALASSGADAVQSALGLPPEAFTYLTSHGALDQDHMKFFERLMNTIDDPEDQQAITAMAHDIFGLFAGVFASIPMEALDEAA